VQDAVSHAATVKAMEEYITELFDFEDVPRCQIFGRYFISLLFISFMPQ
jgi:hypothetical protein